MKSVYAVTNEGNYEYGVYELFATEELAKRFIDWHRLHHPHIRGICIEHMYLVEDGDPHEMFTPRYTMDQLYEMIGHKFDLVKE